MVYWVGFNLLEKPLMNTPLAKPANLFLEFLPKFNGQRTEHSPQL